jgi:hypothetical protein
MKNILSLKKSIGIFFLSLITKACYSLELPFTKYLRTSGKFHFIDRTLVHVEEVFSAYPYCNFAKHFSLFDTIISGSCANSKAAIYSLKCQRFPRPVIKLMQDLRSKRLAAERMAKRKVLQKKQEEPLLLLSQGLIEDADRLAKRPLYMDVSPSLLSAEYKGCSERTVQEIRYLLARDYAHLAESFKTIESILFACSFKKEQDTYLALVECKKVQASVIEGLVQKRRELVKQDAQGIIDFGADDAERLLKSLA